MKALYQIIIISILSFKINAQSVTITPKGNTSPYISLSTTTDISQTGTPTVSQLIYNTNPNITGSDANGIGYYYWNGLNWQSLDANIPQSTIIFSETHPNQNLISAGFSMIGTTQITTPALEVWQNVDTTNILSKRGRIPKVIYHNNKFILWGGINSFSSGSSPLRSGKFYDPENDIWSDIDTTNAPINSSGIYELKSLILYGNKILNPTANLWITISNLNAPPNNGLNLSDTSSNKGYYLAENIFKEFDAEANVWNDLSLINAPLNIVLKFKKDNKIIVLSQTELGIYDIITNNWMILPQTNFPDFFSEYDIYKNFISGNKIIFYKNVYPNPVFTFKVYDINNNTWGNWSSYSPTEPLGNLGNLYFISKSNNKNYLTFSNFVSEYKNFISIYDEQTQTWNEAKIPDRDKKEFSFVSLCGNKIIFFRHDLVSTSNRLFDGYMYDIETQIWTYIPIVFGRHAISSDCCSEKFFFSFGGYYPNGGNFSAFSFTNKSGLMRLSGSTNLSTSKIIYLYKKN